MSQSGGKGNKIPTQRVAKDAPFASVECWGSYRPHNHLSITNITNICLCGLVLLPSVFFVQQASKVCLEVYPDLENFRANPPSWSDFQYDIFGIGNVSNLGLELDSHRSPLCHAYLRYPIFTVNVLFFVNISVLFWIIGLLQKSFWLIDPFWTIIPPLIAAFYATHPMAVLGHGWSSPDLFRSTVSILLIAIWSIRLTYSYFRREDFKFGQREDWRYTMMARQYKNWWWLVSFFAVGLAQQPLLVGISMPIAATHVGLGAELPTQWTDYLSAFLAFAGITVAEHADRTLHAYMIENERRRKLHKPVQLLLNNGLWKYSRHPNYFGEQLFWWALCGLAIPSGATWMFIGPMMNSIVLWIVTLWTEQKMLSEWSPDRAAMYRKYQKNTSVLVPMPPTKQGKEL